MTQTNKPARTVLEQRIQELRQTQEEFAEYATAYARAHNERATLSARHLQRLVAGRNADGSPIGLPRPPTSRLLERIFGAPIGQLLSAPVEHGGAVAAHPLRVAIAVVQKGTDVLVVSPRVTEAEAVTWQFPAGIVKPGLSAEAVAVRETFAETDIRCVVERGLGNRVHPDTNVFCEYLLCAYVAGTARNVDTVENADVTWVHSARLTQLVPAGRIYEPILEVLESR